MKINCDHYVEWLSTFGTLEQSPCSSPAKYSVEFKESARGQIVKRNVCGIHLNSLKKYEARLKKKYNYEVGLKINELC